MAHVLVMDWNGRDVPPELRKLPAGRYVLEELGVRRSLTRQEEDGLRRALASVKEGRTRGAAEVYATLDALIEAGARKTKRRPRRR